MFDEIETGKFPLTPELAALERQLTKMELSPPRLDRDRLMFSAGRAAERTAMQCDATGCASKAAPVARVRHWFWPATTAVATAACLLLAAILAWQVEPQPIAQQDAKPQVAAEPAVPAIRPQIQFVADDLGSRRWIPPADSGYLAIRHVALTRGVGALKLDSLSSNGREATLGKPPMSRATARELLNELLPETRARTRS
ncbi:MAG TPA: hypothetical protein VGK58_03290 [Lacipirellulaceae bacterium]